MRVGHRRRLACVRELVFAEDVAHAQPLVLQVLQHHAGLVAVVVRVAQVEHGLREARAQQAPVMRELAHKLHGHHHLAQPHARVRVREFQAVDVVEVARAFRQHQAARAELLGEALVVAEALELQEGHSVPENDRLTGHVAVDHVHRLVHRVVALELQVRAAARSARVEQDHTLGLRG